MHPALTRCLSAMCTPSMHLGCALALALALAGPACDSDSDPHAASDRPGVAKEQDAGPETDSGGEPTPEPDTGGGSPEDDTEGLPIPDPGAGGGGGPGSGPDAGTPPGADAGAPPVEPGSPDAGAPAPDAGTPPTPEPIPDSGVAIFSISPSRAEFGPEDLEVEIRGEGFDDALIWRIGPATLLDTFTLDGVLAIGYLPPDTLDPGVYDVLAQRGGDLVAVLPQGFQVGAPGVTAGPSPVLQSITPAAVPLGTSANLIFIGEGFQPGATIRIGERDLSQVQVSNATTMQGLVLGDHFRNPGLYDVEIRNPDGGTLRLAQRFLVNAAPEDEGGCRQAPASHGTPAAPLALLFGALLGLRRRTPPTPPSA